MSLAAITTWITTTSGIAADRVRWADQDVTRPAGAGAWISLRMIADTSNGRGWLTSAYNGITFDGAIAGVDAGGDTVTLSAHGLQTGDGPVRLTTTGTPPGGLATGVSYWVIRVDADRVRLASSFLAAVETPAPIDVTSTGTGAHRIVHYVPSSGGMPTVRAGAEIAISTHGTRTGTLSIQCYGGAAVGVGSPRAILEAVKERSILPSVSRALRAGDIGIGWLGDVRDLTAAFSTKALEPRAVLEARIHTAAASYSETATLIETIAATGSAA